MTATADAEAAANELTPLADYLGSVLRRLRALPPLDLDLTQAYGNVLAEDVVAPHSYPAFDQAAVDGYAARWEDISGGSRGGGGGPPPPPRARAPPPPRRGGRGRGGGGGGAGGGPPPP
ncbi:molybdopterin biosynthesis enzyme, partial [Micromonospora sp. H404/HB375]|nr:molybdopterin biosynthesis enzyme [Micromonospora sp. H404/HB375]